MLFERNAFVVTQSFTLLYRRLAVGTGFAIGPAHPKRRRLCGLKIRDTEE